MCAQDAAEIFVRNITSRPLATCRWWTFAVSVDDGELVKYLTTTGHHSIQGDNSNAALVAVSMSSTSNDVKVKLALNIEASLAPR